MNILELIKTRRSVRKFKKQAIAAEVVKEILEAARWAPSGLNNQPWKFMVLKKEEKDVLAKFTHYDYIVKGADKAILVFLDKEVSYNYEKDLMAVGACIQNMLLYIHSLELGACWLGEILNQRKGLQEFLKIPKHLELEAAIALGYPECYPRKIRRKELRNLILK